MDVFKHLPQLFLWSFWLEQAFFTITTLTFIIAHVCVICTEFIHVIMLNPFLHLLRSAYLRIYSIKRSRLDFDFRFGEGKSKKLLHIIPQKKRRISTNWWRNSYWEFLSTSIYDLVLLNVCHYLHRHRTLSELFKLCIPISHTIEILVLIMNLVFMFFKTWNIFSHNFVMKRRKNSDFCQQSKLLFWEYF